jgi:hypothetical protein
MRRRGPGVWGPTAGSPDSPGNQMMFQQPWNANCIGSGCPAQSARRKPATRTPKSCGHWFGAGVAALLCSPRRLRHALRHERLGAKGAARIRLTERARRSGTLRIASAPGVVQVVGRPLRFGDRLVVRGAVPRDARLFVRGWDNRSLVEARFRARDVGNRTVIRLIRRSAKHPRGRQRAVAAIRASAPRGRPVIVAARPEVVG